MEQSMTEMHTRTPLYVPIPIEIVERMAGGEETLVDVESLRPMMKFVHDEYLTAEGDVKKMRLSELPAEKNAFFNEVSNSFDKLFPGQRLLIASIAPKEPGDFEGDLEGHAAGYESGDPFLPIYDMLAHIYSITEDINGGKIAELVQKLAQYIYDNYSKEKGDE